MPGATRGPPVTHRMIQTLLAFALLCAPLASAQVNPVLELSSTTTRVTLGPNETTVVQVTARNSGGTQGTVTLAPSALQGWTFQLSETTFTLDRSTSKTVELTIRSGPHGPSPPKNGSFTLQGSIVGPAGQAGTPGSYALPMTYAAPAAPPVPPAPPPPNLVLPVIASVAALLAVLGALYLLQARRVRLTVTPPEQEAIGGNNTTYEVRVENRSRSTKTIELRIRGLHRPWFAAFSFPTVEVTGQSSTVVPLSIKAPLESDGDARIEFRVQARPNRFSPWLVGASVAANVITLPRPGPAVAAPAGGAAD